MTRNADGVKINDAGTAERWERAVKSLCTTSIFWWPSRRRAPDALANAELTPEQRERACGRLTAHVLNCMRNPQRKFVERYFFWLVGLLVLSAVVTGNVLRSFGNALDLADGESSASLPWFIVTAVVVSSPLIAFAWSLFFSLRSATCRAAVEALGILKHPDGLPAVAAALWHGRLSETASRALRCLADVIGPQHYGRFAPSVESDLVFMLYAVDEPAAIDIVTILGRVGGARSLPALERIAEHGYTGRKRAAARQALPAMRERIEREREAERLLRPSFAADDTLLHPVVAGRNDDGDRLLRPAAPGDGL